MARLNRDGALRLLDGDTEIYSKIVEAFSGDVPIQLRVMNAALAANNVAEVARVAHSLKSAAATIGAEDLHDILYKLERAASGRAPDSVRQLVEQAEREIEAVMAELARLDSE